MNKTNDQDFTDEDISLAEEIAEHLQGEVDAIFLDQEVFGLSEQLYSVARKTRNTLIAMVILVPILALAAMAFLPRLSGG